MCVYIYITSDSLGRDVFWSKIYESSPTDRSEWRWAHSQGSGTSGGKSESGREGGEWGKVLSSCWENTGCRPLGLWLRSRAGDTRPALTWQLLAKPLPSSDVRDRGHWAASGSDTGLLSVQDREAQSRRGRESDKERARDIH